MVMAVCMTFSRPQASIFHICGPYFRPVNQSGGNVRLLLRRPKLAEFIARAPITFRA